MEALIERAEKISTVEEAKSLLAENIEISQILRRL